jgi:hypothetical protein
MLRYEKDKNNQDILLDSNNDQIMMEWEIPLMNAHIDELKPHGNVLEIGFGMGYSATQIQKYKPDSYTVIECDINVIKKCREWSKDYDNVTIIEGNWQDVLDKLGVYDSIFFDPTQTSDLSKMAYRIAHFNWHFIFIELCIKYHMNTGSRLSIFLPSVIIDRYNKFIKDQIGISYYNKSITMPISNDCRYKNDSEALIIPIIIFE